MAAPRRTWRSASWRAKRPPSTEASTTVSMVDARQLARWHLDARRLPAGTVVRFREPTLWERHRWEIIVVLSVLAGQTLVVAALLFERRRRQRAQAALEDRLRFETLLTEISAGFADPPGGVLREPDRTARPADSVDDLVREGLRRIAQGLGAEGREPVAVLDLRGVVDRLLVATGAQRPARGDLA